MGGLSRHSSLFRQPRAAASNAVGTKKKRRQRRSVDLTKIPETRQEWTIHIKTLTGRDFDVICHPYDSIEHLRARVAKKEDIEADRIYLLNDCGRFLVDGDTLRDWYLTEGSIVFMNFRLRGG